MLERQQIQRKKKFFLFFFLLYIIYKKIFFILFFLFFHILPDKTKSKILPIRLLTFFQNYDIIRPYDYMKTSVLQTTVRLMDFTKFSLISRKWKQDFFPTVSQKVVYPANLHCIAKFCQSTNLLLYRKA